MSATDELREGLRKRGESWHKWPDDDSTTWQAYSNPHTAIESMDGKLIVTGLTPEQAIAATLGSGTCRMERGAGTCRMDKCKDYRVGRISTSWGCVCSNCRTFHEFTHGDGWNFCPSCGRRIEVDA